MSHRVTIRPSRILSPLVSCDYCQRPGANMLSGELGRTGRAWTAVSCDGHLERARRTVEERLLGAQLDLADQTGADARAGDPLEQLGLFSAVPRVPAAEREAWEADARELAARAPAVPLPTYSLAVPSHVCEDCGRLLEDDECAWCAAPTRPARYGLSHTRADR